MKPTPAPPGSAPGERLQKFLASAGLGSRRECEELIVQGRVEVDRQVVDQLGARVDPGNSEVRVDGVVLHAPRLRYFLLHKPMGVLCTQRDPQGRARAVDLIRCEQRVYPVGRLDLNSEGMLLLTNDGEFANQITHPRYGVRKTYHVLVAGRPSLEQLQQLEKGVYLAEGTAKVEGCRVKKRLAQCTVLEMVLKEGKNREIRRVLARVGHKVLRLKRVAIGDVKLGALPQGSSRELTRDEVHSLLNESRGRRQSAKPRSGASPPRKSRSPRPTGGPPKRQAAVASRPPRAKTRPLGERAPGAVIGGEEVRTPPSQAARPARSASGAKKVGRRPPLKGKRSGLGPVSRGASQPSATSASKPKFKSASKPPSKSASEPPSTSASKPGSKSASKPKFKSASKPSFKSASKSNSASKPPFKSNKANRSKSAAMSSAKPKFKTTAKPKFKPKFKSASKPTSKPKRNPRYRPRG